MRMGPDLWWRLDSASWHGLNLERLRKSGSRFGPNSTPFSSIGRCYSLLCFTNPIAWSRARSFSTVGCYRRAILNRMEGTPGRNSGIQEGGRRVQVNTEVGPIAIADGPYECPRGSGEKACGGGPSGRPTGCVTSFKAKLELDLGGSGTPSSFPGRVFSPLQYSLGVDFRECSRAVTNQNGGTVLVVGLHALVRGQCRRRRSAIRGRTVRLRETMALHSLFAVEGRPISVGAVGRLLPAPGPTRLLHG